MTLSDLREIKRILNVDISLESCGQTYVATVKRDGFTITCADRDIERAVERAVTRFIEYARKNPTAVKS